MMLVQDTPYVQVEHYPEPEDLDATRFMFAEVNPLKRETNTTYAESWFSELPWWAWDVLHKVGIPPSQWNELVVEGAALTVPAIEGEHYLGGSLWPSELRHRLRSVPAEDVCVMCWGTGIADDCDGSVTGYEGEPYVCPCLSGMASRPVEHTGGVQR